MVSPSAHTRALLDEDPIQTLLVRDVSLAAAFIKNSTTRKFLYRQARESFTVKTGLHRLIRCSLRERERILLHEGFMGRFCDFVAVAAIAARVCVCVGVFGFLWVSL